MKNFTIENNIIKGAEVKFPEYRDFGAVILDTLSSEPNHVGQIDADTGKQTTFAEMKDRSVRCALWLKKMGMKSDDFVVICTHNQLDCYIPIFATLYNGATCTTWPHQVTIESARYSMQLFKPKIIFSCEKAADTLIEAAKLENISTEIIVFGRNQDLKSLDEILVQQSNEEIDNFQTTPILRPKETPALIALTSGSTGEPKGVMHSYYNFIKLTSYTIFPSKSVNLWYSNCYWVTGFCYIFVTLFSHGTRIIHVKFDAEDTCQVIEKYKVNIVFASPILMYDLCKLDIFQKYRLESLKTIISGGIKINKHLFEQLQQKLPHVKVIKAYGLSEVLGSLTTLSNESKNKDSNGCIESNMQIKIVDAKSGEALGPNQPGELCFKSPVMMMGYYKDPENTKQAIDDEGWLHSKDLAYYDENGEIVVIDRLYNVIKYKDHRIYPSQIEEILLSHPGVMEATVVPVPHETDGEHAMAFVKKHHNIEVSELELTALLFDLEGSKKFWDGVMILESLPKLTNSKFDKIKLSQMAKELLRR